jgi:hypothetical protein
MLSDFVNLALMPFAMAVRPRVGLVLTGTVDQVRQAARRALTWPIRGIEITGHERAADPSCNFIVDLQELRFVRLYAAPLTNIECLQRLPRLRHVSISRVARRQSIPIDFASLPALERADIEWFEGAETIFEARRLRSLVLANYPASSSKAFESLSELTALDLPAGRLTEIDACRQLPALRWLALAMQHKLINFDGLSQSALGFLWIEGCQQLRTLEWLAGMEHLETLRILDCGKIVGAEVFSSLPCLRHIHIHGDVRLEIKDFAFLKNLPGIESVFLKGMPADEAEYWKKRNKRYGLLRADLRQGVAAR